MVNFALLDAHTHWISKLFNSYN